MRKVRYLIYCIIHMDYAGLFSTVKQCHKESGKNSIWLFFDIVYCGLKYGAGYRDYYLCQWYNLNKAQRATYVTRGINNSIVRICNDRNYYHCFDNKQEFNTIFNDYLKRKWLYTPESDLAKFEEMMSDLDQVIIKPCDQRCGTGVEKLNKSDFKSLAEMYEYITSKGNYVIEEVIQQHEELNKIYPYAINTLRIVTVLDEENKDCNVIYAFIRIGNEGRIVDNINAGGMCAPIDLETGRITHVAYDKDAKTYEYHPMTHTKIVGTVIPHWHEAMQICKDASHRVPQMRYVGWDVAMTPNGPVFVEGNNIPGHDILQLPPHVPERIGMLPRFKMFVKGL